MTRLATATRQVASYGKLLRVVAFLGTTLKIAKMRLTAVSPRGRTSSVTPPGHPVQAAPSPNGRMHELSMPAMVDYMANGRGLDPLDEQLMAEMVSEGCPNC